MRLCALAQPAYIRVTRRRSVLPSPSSSIPEEDNTNGRSERTQTERTRQRPAVDRLDNGRSISDCERSTGGLPLPCGRQLQPVVLRRRVRHCSSTRLGDAEILANARRHWLDDLVVTRHGARLPVGWVPVDGVAAPLSEELAAVAFEVADKVRSLHSTGTATASRST